MMQQTITQTTQATAGWKFLVGLLGALWSASGGTSSTMTVLNFAYEVKEKRPYWKSRILVAVSLTIVLTTLMFAALAIVLAGEALVSWATSHGLSSALAVIWKIAQYAIALFFVVLAFAVLYHYGPDIEDQKWYWITPGSVIGVLLWVAASAGFRVYLHFFDTYSATYGSLGAVIILMLWFYITALAFLIGAEINAEIEHAAAERGRADAKLKGEREAPAA
jgi:membrane protein